MKHTTLLATAVTIALCSFSSSANWLNKVNEAVNPTETKAAPTVSLNQVADISQSADLVTNVVSQLGLTETQAQGGLGTLLSLAKSQLGGNDFSTLSKSIPNTDSLLAAVPGMDNKKGMTGLLSKAGNLGSSLQGSAMVYDSFEKLGISKEYIMPMVNLAQSYLEQTSGADTANLLQKGLSSLL